MNTKSSLAFNTAQKLIPGGVNSPVRSFKSIGIDPIFFEKGAGAIMTDVDGNEYIDFCASWGVFLLGHAHPTVTEKVTKRIQNGSSFGAPTAEENRLAKLVVEAVPSIEKVRFVNSGTEAVMSAVRLARAFTGKNKLVKFEGCYHGHADHLLVNAGSGVAETGVASTPGVPDDFTKHTLSLPFNNEEAVKAVFKAHGDDIAAIIVEPVPANMGVVPAKESFLSLLRDITLKHNALLIFDEVITGFRPAFGGAQEYFDILPDITTLGKIIGGGFPVGAFGGRADIMDMLAPKGPVYQAGTLSGNPVAMAAGESTLQLLARNGFYLELNEKASAFFMGLKEIISPYPVSLATLGPMFTLFFRESLPQDFDEVGKCDFDKFGAFYRAVLSSGIYLSPSQYETHFVTDVHSEDMLQRTLIAIKRALAEVFG